MEPHSPISHHHDHFSRLGNEHFFNAFFMPGLPLGLSLILRFFSVLIQSGESIPPPVEPSVNPFPEHRGFLDSPPTPRPSYATTSPSQSFSTSSVSSTESRSFSNYSEFIPKVEKPDMGLLSDEPQQQMQQLQIQVQMQQQQHHQSHQSEVSIFLCTELPVWAVTVTVTTRSLLDDGA